MMVMTTSLASRSIYFLLHRFFAATAAIWERLRGLSARAVPPLTAQRDSMGILGWVYRLGYVRIELRRFTDGFQEDLVGELVGIAWAGFC
jgi:hypothetical protein